MNASGRRDGWLVLVAASLFSAVLGSVHAFSVFLQPLEAQFEVGRSATSLIYSGTLICLTVAVLFGHRIYARVSAAAFVFLTALMGGLGALVAGYAPNLLFVWLGYCMLFGFANGLGYGFGLQIAAQFNPGHEGFAMGLVTATYALGAVLSPVLFEWALDAGGFRRAMAGLACGVMVTGILSAMAMQAAHAGFLDDASDAKEPEAAPVSSASITLLWVTYFGGVMAGLMIIGHAAGIAAEAEGARQTWLAPAILALCNLGGSLTGGSWADRYPARLTFALLSSLTVLALLALAGDPGFSFVLASLGVVGFAYGGTIAAHPAYIAKQYGRQNSAKVYGRVFTAWGTAGLAGPWLAGALYDSGGTYLSAFLIAACFGCVSVATTMVLFRSA